MSLQVRAWSVDDSEAWDAFVAGSWQGTLLHTRRFLSYHGERFTDCSLMLEADGQLQGVFPAARHPTQAGTVVSHPGATYGGLLHQGALRGERMIEALQAITAYYAAANFRELLYKAVPSIYAQPPAADDAYALFRLGAIRYRVDLSSTIDLGRPPALSSRRRRGIQKARKANLQLATGAAWIAPLWQVLADNLQQRHGVVPVHTIAELALLAERFPEAISCHVMLAEGAVVAGVILFSTGLVWHCQYIASNAQGQACGALDQLFACLIDQAGSAGARWFDFGICTEEQGQLLNSGLYNFKNEFGAGATIHEFYQLTLVSSDQERHA